MDETDIAVVGAGVSGIAAAVTAARLGCRTLLLEKSAFPGGIAVKGNIHTICGLFINRSDGSPEMLYTGVPEEFARRLMSHDSVESPVKMGRVHVLLSRPKTIEETIQTLLKTEATLSVKYSTQFCGVRLNNDRICHINAIVAGSRREIKVGAVVDCSGDAIVCRSAGVPVMAPDESTQVPAMIFPLINIDSFVKSPRPVTPAKAGVHNMPEKLDCGLRRNDNNGGFSTFYGSVNIDHPGHFSIMAVRIKTMLKQAVNQGILPQGSESVSLLPMLEKGSIAVKLNLGRFVRGFSSMGNSSIEEFANELKDHLFRFVQKNVAGFERCRVPSGEYPVLHRDGMKAKGVYVLSGEDVLNGKKFSDAATKGCWPIEKWDSAGDLDIRYLPESLYYDIPERSLRVPGIKNLMIAGKCISADSDAIASARVIGSCLATGEAAAKLAARSLT